MHDTVRKGSKMGAGQRLRIKKARGWQKNFGPRYAKLWYFANSSGQISVLCVVTGIDLAEMQGSATLRLSLMRELSKTRGGGKQL